MWAKGLMFEIQVIPSLSDTKVHRCVSRYWPRIFSVCVCVSPYFYFLHVHFCAYFRQHVYVCAGAPQCGADQLKQRRLMTRGSESWRRQKQQQTAASCRQQEMRWPCLADAADAKRRRASKTNRRLVTAAAPFPPSVLQDLLHLQTFACLSKSALGVDSLNYRTNDERIKICLVKKPWAVSRRL